MTRKLDLRTGKPVWKAYRAPGVPAVGLERDASADVLVVGMGISGAMIAELLSAEGLSVICIDRRGPLRGSTAATTALVQYEIDQPLTVLARQAGADFAARAWRRSRLALANLEGRIASLGIDCRMERRCSLYLAGNRLTGSRLRAEADARRACGIDATYLTASELSARHGIDRAGAILGHGNLALDPLKLGAGLLLAAHSRGARLHAPVEATGFRRRRGGIEVTTRDGPVIAARDVVLATGYELAAPVPARGHSIISTWAIATRPQKEALWPGAAFLWEASDPYLYVRATADGRVICGGEDEEFSDEERRDALIAEKTRTIAGKLARLLPRIDPTPEHAWAGSFGTTPTGLPLIGRLPGEPRLHAVLGYGGNGITFSRIAAELVCSAIAGRRDRDADLFAFPG